MLISTFCDEIGYLAYDDNAAALLYEVINRRYERRSVIVTTNRLCGAAHKVFVSK
jgi:DNA replication protein DnaC